MKHYLNLFKRFFMIMLFLPFFVNAQNKLSDFISNDGKLSKPMKTGIRYSEKVKYISKDSVIAETTKITAIKKTIYGKLKEAVKQTLDSLNDEQNQLSNFYSFIWGDRALTEEKDKLTFLINHFETNGKPSSNDPFIKYIDDSINEYSNLVWIRLYGKYLARKTLVEIDVYEEDYFKTFLLRYIKPYVERCPLFSYSSEFISKKKTFTDLLKRAIAIKGNTSFQCNVNDEPNQVTSIIKEIKENDIYKLIKNSDLLKNQFWINGGNFRLDPFSALTTYNWPSIQNFNEVITQKIDSLKRCCNDDPAKIEALFKAIETGKNRFKYQNGTAFGYKSLKEIFASDNFVNQFFIPVITYKQCCETGYEDNYKKKWVINYDASNDYKSDGACLKPSVPEDEQIIISVNNVPAEKNVIISATDAALSDQSKAQSALSDIGTGLSAAYTAVNPLAGIISSVITAPSVVFPSQASINYKGNSSYLTNIFNKMVTSPLEFSLSDSKKIADEHKQKKLSVPNFVEVLVGDQTLTFPGSTKKNILDALISGTKDGNNAIMKKAEEVYLNSNCYEANIDFTTPEETNQKVTDLINSFSEFYKNNIQRQKKEIDLLHQYILQMNYIENALEAITPIKDLKVTKISLSSNKTRAKKKPRINPEPLKV